MTLCIPHVPWQHRKIFGLWQICRVGQQKYMAGFVVLLHCLRGNPHQAPPNSKPSDAKISRIW